MPLSIGSMVFPGNFFAISGVILRGNNLPDVAVFNSMLQFFDFFLFSGRQVQRRMLYFLLNITMSIGGKELSFQRRTCPDSVDFYDE